jgi:hypothetical protein
MSEFRGDYYGIRQMLNSPEMVEEMRRRAEHIRHFAEEIAPVAHPWEDDAHRGRYKASFHSDAEPFGGSHPPHSRAEGRVWNDSPEARYVEYGADHRLGFQEGYHTLVRALHETHGGEL